MRDGATGWPEKFAERYRRKGYWAGQALGGLPAQWAARFGDRIAIVADDHRWSYRELDNRSNVLASGFQALGIGRDDPVVVQLPNRAEFLEVLFALFKIGSVPVVILPAYREDDVARICDQTAAVAYVAVERHAGCDFRELATTLRHRSRSLRHTVIVGEAGPHSRLNEIRAAGRDRAAERWPHVDPGEVALFHLSGGTTGKPKLIPRTHDDYFYGARASAELCAFDASSVYLCSLPIIHQFSLSAPGVLGTLNSGGRVVLASYPAPDITFPLIEREQVTVAALVPPVVPVWLNAAREPSSIYRVCVFSRSVVRG